MHSTTCVIYGPVHLFTAFVFGLRAFIFARCNRHITALCTTWTSTVLSRWHVFTRHRQWRARSKPHSTIQPGSSRCALVFVCESGLSRERKGQVMTWMEKCFCCRLDRWQKLQTLSWRLLEERASVHIKTGFFQPTSPKYLVFTLLLHIRIVTSNICEPEVLVWTKLHKKKGKNPFR